MLRKTLLSFIFAMLVCVLAGAAVFAQTGVTAEAVGTANLRTLPGTEGTDVIGMINAGTQYPVIGRSEFFPWLLLASPASNQPLGWVFTDLVTVSGNLGSVPISTLDLSADATAPTDQIAPTPAAEMTQPIASLAASPTASAPIAATPAPVGIVTGTAMGEINIRYGPGTDYPRIGVARAGEVFELTARHVLMPWVQIVYPSSPTGFGWILLELLQVTGDVETLPATSQTSFSFPSLTPTPSGVRSAEVAGVEVVPPSPEFAALGEQIAAMMLNAGFDPVTSTFGAFFLMDLQTGEALSIGSDIAFSGMSVNKVAILADYFLTFESPLRDDQAITLAEAIVCSENISTNEMLSAIGGGSPFTGAERVSEMLAQLGLGDMFIYTPYANDPFITPEAPFNPAPRPGIDQVSAQPDPYNQLTINEIGALLNGMYQCAYNDSGILLETFPDSFTPDECRDMLSIMNNNRVGNLLERGIPANIPLAHKHGWIDDTHGDAGIIFSPGGTYILAVVMHGPTWLNFEQSEPLVADISRIVYNYFNPDQPLLETRTIDAETVGDVAACLNSLLGNPLITQLTERDF